MDFRTSFTSKFILLIEDNFEIRDNISEMLTLENHNVLSVSSGEQGLKIIQQKLPDLILCDIVMPNLSGFQVLGELKSKPKTSGIPFFFISASVEKNEIEKAINMGANGYIFKPFELEDITQKIDLC